MGDRTAFQALLEIVIGSRNVYFQPPESISLQYPCVVYELQDVKKDYADCYTYNYRKQYKVTVIDPNPDSTVNDKILDIPMGTFDRHYTSNNLHHYVHNIYY